MYNKNLNNPTTQKKHKFNVIDIMAWVAVVLAIIIVFLVIDPFHWIADHGSEKVEKTIHYVVKLPSVDRLDSYRINAGRLVNVMTPEGLAEGKIIAVDKSSSSNWELSSDTNEMKLVTDSNKNTVFVTIEITCHYINGTGYFINSKQLLVGDNNIGLKFDFHEADNYIVGECVSLAVTE